MYNKMETDAFN